MKNTATASKKLTAPARTALESIYNADGRTLSVGKIDGRVMRGLRTGKLVKNAKGGAVTFTDAGLRAYETAKSTTTSTDGE